jgi:hypothetical protein
MAGGAADPPGRGRPLVRREVFDPNHREAEEPRTDDPKLLRRPRTSEEFHDDRLGHHEVRVGIEGAPHRQLDWGSRLPELLDPGG